MAGHYITIEATGARVSIGNYIRGILKAKANPDAVFTSGLTTWAPCTGQDIMRDFLHGVHERINRKNGQGKGRKWEHDWFCNARNTARQVNTPRLIVRMGEVFYPFRERLAHRIFDERTA